MGLGLTASSAFLKKTAQKTFICSGASPVARPAPKVIKVFLVLFFQKKNRLPPH
jgi:hypothetical protein